MLFPHSPLFFSALNRSAIPPIAESVATIGDNDPRTAVVTFYPADFKKIRYELFAIELHAGFFQDAQKLVQHQA